MGEIKKNIKRENSTTNSIEGQFNILKTNFIKTKEEYEKELLEIAQIKEQITKLTEEIAILEIEKEKQIETINEEKVETPNINTEEENIPVEAEPVIEEEEENIIPTTATVIETEITEAEKNTEAAYIKTEENIPDEINTEENENIEEVVPIIDDKAEAEVEEARIEEVVEQAIDLVEKDNEEIIENEISELQKESANNDSKTKPSTLKKIGNFLFKQIKRKFIKYVVLPASIATAVTLSYHTPAEYYDMYQNYKERHFEKEGVDDPSIIGISNLYNDSTDVEKTTYDFIGDHKIDYKEGYYITSVFDLSDQTPPRFKLINSRENYNKLDSVAGITTNLFKKFYNYSDFVPKLKNHENKNDEEKGELPVIGYNIKDKTIKAGHYKEFDDNWMVSETYEIPLNFKMNADSTINLAYHAQALRMVPLTTNENGKQIPFPIGVTYNKDIKKMNPSDCTHFGTLEGGKVIMVCGDKQLQVNGSFSDMFKVYERLQRENKSTTIQAYLLDNGSYNLPIWDKDSTITPQEIKKHLMRNPDGGTALALINDNRISPYEYKSKYKEFEHYTPNFTLDSITGKPAKNEKSVIVLHHTGNYEDPNLIIKQFEGAAEVSAHCLILKDGTRHLFEGRGLPNGDDYVLAHAGKSDFNDKNKANYFSLGIEIEGDTQNGHQFTVAQLESLLEYIRPRVEKYKIPIEDITTHKIIRDNYIKKHPNVKGVLTKRDLDDQVWKQIQNLIQKKVYERGKIKITKNASKMVGALSYQDAYHKTKSKNYSINQTKKFLAKYNSKSNNNETVNWIKHTV